MNELKNCPFCGSDDIHIDSEKGLIDEEDEFYQIECWECESSTGWHFDLKEAIQAWNRRASNE
ncbi:Lar family restriction alleviation protein [Arsenophonus apicola]|uniref:Lar family restriction alleviation protein n=1 Tax=Arsenophonus apicola TaxID=2879119 RepID=A0ABY8NYI8_9GAMM|nr:Lar family restriction alleviation protein [Arsenophonus apicola]WGO82317.1 Lar family restriction alleviation protein [Arsenophonus apicola]